MSSRKKIAKDRRRNSVSFSLNRKASFHGQPKPIDHELLKIKDTMNRNEALLKEETQRTKDLITYLAHDLKDSLSFSDRLSQPIVGYEKT